MPWAQACDLGALLHGFLLRFGALFDCSREVVSIEQARAAALAHGVARLMTGS